MMGSSVYLSSIFTEIVASLRLYFFNQSVKRDVSSAEASAMHCAAAEKQAVNGGVAKNELFSDSAHFCICGTDQSMYSW